MNYSEKSKCSRDLFRFKTLNVSQWVTLCYIFFLEKKRRLRYGAGGHKKYKRRKKDEDDDDDDDGDDFRRPN